MGTKIDRKGAAGQKTHTVTSAEFRANSQTAIRAAVAGKTVTVTDARGKPRMHILRQTEPLDD